MMAILRIGIFIDCSGPSDKTTCAKRGYRFSVELVLSIIPEIPTKKAAVHEKFARRQLPLNATAFPKKQKRRPRKSAGTTPHNSIAAVRPDKNTRKTQTP